MLPATRKTENQAPQIQGIPRLCAEHSGHVLTLLTRLIGPGKDEGYIEKLARETMVTAAERLVASRTVSNPRRIVEMSAVDVAINARRLMWCRGLFGNGSLAKALVRAKLQAATRKPTNSEVELYEMLDLLTEKKRTVFILHELMDMPCPAIGEVVGCPVNTAYARLRHARAELLALREAMESAG